MTQRLITHVKINRRGHEVHAVEFDQIIRRPEGSDEPVRVLGPAALLAELECRRGERRPGDW
jgi:hypothetical protein